MVSKLIGLIFGIMGLGMLAIALVFFISTSLSISSSLTADGTVIDGGDTSGGRKVTAIIQFTDSTGQAVRFRSAIASNPAEFQTGQKVKVYYKQSDSSGTAMADSLISLWFWALLLGFLGLVFSLIGLGGFFVWYTGYRKKKWLQQHGQRITAQITEVKVNKNVHNMGKSPYYVLAQSRDTFDSITPTFKSHSVWNLPATATPGAYIEVLVDPNNYRRYYVELADEKKQATANGRKLV